MEQIVILNDTTKDSNKILEYDINKTVNLYRLERSMEEAVSTFQSVVKAEKCNGGPQQKHPLAEN